MRTLTGLVVAVAEPGIRVNPKEPVEALMDVAGAKDVACATAPGVDIGVLLTGG